MRHAGWASAALPSEEERQALRRVRRLLTSMVDALMVGRPLAAGDRSVLNRLLAKAPVVRRLVEDRTGAARVELMAAGSGIEAVIGAAAGSFAEMLATGETSRVGRCANPDCRWVFYDESRNRTRRWCDPIDCGNLIKVRRFRARHRARRERTRRSSARRARAIRR